MKIGDCKYVVMNQQSLDVSILHVELVEPMTGVRGWKVKTMDSGFNPKLMNVPTAGLYDWREAREKVIEGLKLKIADFQEVMKTFEEQLK